MTVDTETSKENIQDKNWIDKLFQFVEMMTLVLIIIPFGSLALWIITSIFLEGDYFFFFPTAMFSFLPVGIIGLLIQLVRVARKRPTSLFSRFMLKFSIFTVIVGVFAYMAIFVVAG